MSARRGKRRGSITAVPSKLPRTTAVAPESMLPLDVLATVLTYLSFGEYCRISSVCKRWRDAVNRASELEGRMRIMVVHVFNGVDIFVFSPKRRDFEQALRVCHKQIEAFMNYLVLRQFPAIAQRAVDHMRNFVANADEGTPDYQRQQEVYWKVVRPEFFRFGEPGTVVMDNSLTENMQECKLPLQRALVFQDNY